MVHVTSGVADLQLCSAVNERALAVVEEQMLQQDALMTQLAQEFDNGRLLRLLARLVMVSEGSQTSLDPSWSETGKLACNLYPKALQMLASAAELPNQVLLIPLPLMTTHNWSFHQHIAAARIAEHRCALRLL